MSRYDFAPDRAGPRAAPAHALAYERQSVPGYSTTAARTSRAARQDSGLIRVFDDPGDGVWGMNVGALDGREPGLGTHTRRSVINHRSSPIETDPYDDWDMDDAEARRLLGRLATPGAWAAVAIVVLVVLAFVFVTPAFAGVGGAISRYSDLSGSVVGAGGSVAEPVIDASTAPQEAPPQPIGQGPAPSGSYSLIGGPSLSVGQIEAVLQKYGSPAAGLGQKMYDLGVQYGIDPAYALAFFVHESGCGTQGVARVTKSLGNIRWTSGWEDYSGYRKYSSWEAGMEDWYKLITDLYINQWGLRTVDAIVPVYAPSSDGNSPSSYIASVKWMVDDWRGK